MKKLFKRLGVVGLTLSILLSNILINPKHNIEVNAALDVTAGFAEKKVSTYTSACGGHYYIYKTWIPSPGSSECLREHMNGDGCSSARCVKEENKAYDDFGLYYYYAWHECDEHEYETAGGRSRVNYTKCDTCGSTSQAGGGKASINDYCSKSPGKRHYIQGGQNSQAACTFCGALAGSANVGTVCNKSKSATHTVQWETWVSYKDSTGTSKTDKPTGTSKVQYITQYGSSATIDIHNAYLVNTSVNNGVDTSTYSSLGNTIVGYKVYEDGTQVASYGTTDTTNKTYAFEPASYTTTVEGVKNVQFVIYTSAGAFTLPEITLISGVHIYVTDEVKSSYTSSANNSWYSWQDKETLGDLSNTNNVTRTSESNVGIYKITHTSYGGDGHNSGGGEYSKTYIYGWDKNVTKSTSTGAYEPYPGSGQNTTYNHYHTGYKYVGQTTAIINQVDYGTTLKRYFSPLSYTVAFNGNKSTSGSMTSMSFVYDRGQLLNDNKFKREYVVTLKNTEPWLIDKKSTNGNTNSASKSVPYTFLGWNVGSAIGSSPYYSTTSTSNLLTDKQSVGNLNTTNGGTTTLYATWKSNTITLPNTITGSNGFTFLNWSNKAYPDTRVYNKAITSNVDDVNYTVAKNTAYKPYKDTNLYAHWYKDVTLTFNLNGGKLKQNGSSITLKGTFYDYEPGYTFNIYKGLTSQSKGRYDTQINTIDAYGTYNSNGENKLYTKVSSDGTYYRFLGWSLNPNATEPDSDFDVFNPNRKTTYTIQNDTTLYAVWEPVLQANIETSRTLGNLTFEDGTKPITNLPALNSSKGEQSMSVVIRPGEQGFYRIDSTGSNNLTFKIAFDTRITDIYTQGDSDSEWRDELNPSTHEDLTSGQGHGLNRQITGIKNFTRKFHIPQYLGTDRSYETSNPDKTNVPINKYVAVAVLSQPSYYYNSVYGKDEQIIININIYISPNNSSDFNNVEDKLPSIISEIRTRIL